MCTCGTCLWTRMILSPSMYLCRSFLSFLFSLSLVLAFPFYIFSLSFFYSYCSPWLTFSSLFPWFPLFPCLSHKLGHTQTWLSVRFFLLSAEMNVHFQWWYPSNLQSKDHLWHFVVFSSTKGNSPAVQSQITRQNIYTFKSALFHSQKEGTGNNHHFWPIWEAWKKKPDQNRKRKWFCPGWKHPPPLQSWALRVRSLFPMSQTTTEL